MDRKMIDNIVWWIPLKKLRNSIRNYLNYANKDIVHTNEIKESANIILPRYVASRGALTANHVLKLQSFKNQYEGKRCFIVGNAPSLKKLNLSLLKNDFIFTANRGYKLKDIGLEHSNFHIIGNINNYNEFKNEYDFDFFDYLFIRTDFGDRNGLKTDKIVDFEIHPVPILSANGGFQFDITKPLFGDATVVQYAIQMAVYMGFKNLYIIGFDMDYSNANPYCYEQSENEKSRIKFDNSELWRLLDWLSYSENIVKELKKVNIYNAGIGGKIDIIQRVNYDKLFV